MSITTYAELQTAVAAWVFPGGTVSATISAKVVDLITLGEAFINRKLRVPEMLTNATLTTSTSDRFAAFPTRFRAVHSLSYDGEELRQASSKEVAAAADVNTASEPEYYAITSQFEFDRVSDQAYGLTLVYYKGMAIATDLTNWLLTRHPDAYLAAALSEAMPFVRDKDMVAYWKARRDEIIEEISNDENQKRAGYLVSDVVKGGTRQNIISGA